MYFLRFLIVLIAAILATPAFSQTDSSVVKVDSAVGNPASTKPKTVTIKDTTIVPESMNKSEKPAVVKDSARLALEALPRQAAWRSAIVPGLGQIKNGRWWKVPIIYGGLVSVGLAFEFNYRYHREFLEELQYRYNRDANEPPRKNPKYIQYDDRALISAKDFYRRNRDLSALGGLAVYAINIIDAYVDAKFFRYDIGDDLGFKVRPSLLQPYPSYASVVPVPALKLTISL